MLSTAPPATSAIEVASVVAGATLTDAPGGRLQTRSPADLDRVVADVRLGDAATLVGAARAARAAHPGWAAVSAPARG